MRNEMMSLFPAVIIALPLLGFLSVGVATFFGVKFRERKIITIATAITSVCLVLAAMVGMGFAQTTTVPGLINYGNLFQLGHYEFQLILVQDHVSVLFMLMAAFLCWVVGHFSWRYLHNDPGFIRYFLIYMVFAAGIQLTFLAGTTDLLIIGWECVGISSVLLIGFFQHRERPVRNSLAVFVVYRICDVALLALAAYLHHLLGNGNLPVLAENAPLAFVRPEYIGLASVMIVIASLGKGAQLPFSFWLPRAMEGPTPSSAIFYGALSIHAGPYLLLRTSPIWENYPPAKMLIIAIGAATALHASYVGRSRFDVKSVLAYSSMAQVGLIFVEIALGFHSLALTHIIGHSLVRTLQILRSPSAIADARKIRLQHSSPHATPSFMNRVFSETAQLWLFRNSLARGNLEQWLQIAVVGPYLRLAHFFNKFEQENIENPMNSQEIFDRSHLAPIGWNAQEGSKP